MSSAPVAPYEPGQRPLPLARQADLPRRPGDAGLGPRLPRFGSVGLVVCLLQGGILAVLTAIEWHRRALSYDFGVYAQAWWLIGHGHLDPYSSLLGAPFLHNNFELLMWPLALLVPLSGSPLTLLVVQDLALVGTSLVALHWLYEHIQQSAPSSRSVSANSGLEPPLPASARYQGEHPAVSPLAALLVAAVLLVADPWIYMTGTYDFHSEALSGLFVLLAARALWRGGRRPAIAWAVVAVSSGFVGLLAVAGLFGGDVFRQRGRAPASLVVTVLCVGLGIVLVERHLVGGAGLDFRLGFAYLLGAHSAAHGLGAVLGAAAAHPLRVLHAVFRKLPLVVLVLLPCGLVGVVDPWAGGALLAVVGPLLVGDQAVFVAAPEVFQVWPALPVVLVCSFLVAVRPRRVAHRLRRAYLVGWAGLSLATCVGFVRYIPADWFRIEPAQTAVIGSLQRHVDPRCEIVASDAFAGDFAVGRDERSLLATTHDIPLDRSCVVLVLAPAVGRYGVLPAVTSRFIEGLEIRRGLAPVRVSEGISEFVWRRAPVGGDLVVPSAALTPAP